MKPRGGQSFPLRLVVPLSSFSCSIGRAALAGFLLLALAAPLSAQRGALSVPRNLAEMVDQADTIVRGTVLLARFEPHPQLANLHTVVVTLRVEEALKGKPGTLFTYRQFIWDIRDRYDTAGYRKGQRLLLLMNRPTLYGLQTPVGVEQGRFRLLRDGEGKQYAVNGHRNAGLFRELERRLAARGLAAEAALSRRLSDRGARPVAAEDLKTLIRALVRTQ